jgi:hypothetical protein
MKCDVCKAETDDYMYRCDCDRCERETVDERFYACGNASYHTSACVHRGCAAEHPRKGNDMKIDWSKIEEATPCSCGDKKCHGPCPDCGEHVPYVHTAECRQEEDEKTLATSES